MYKKGAKSNFKSEIPKKKKKKEAKVMLIFYELSIWRCRATYPSPELEPVPPSSLVQRSTALLPLRSVVSHSQLAIGHGGANYTRTTCPGYKSRLPPADGLLHVYHHFPTCSRGVQTHAGAQRMRFPPSLEQQTRGVRPR